MRAWRWTGRGFESLDALPAPLARAAEPVLLLPPLWDHHGHLLALGAQREEADLRGCGSVSEALSRVGAALPRETWIVGSGWDQELWDGAFPTAAMLEPVACGRPCYLRRVDGHAAWLSVEAMRLAGIGPSTQDPPGGRLLREDGSPTGILLDNAMLPVEALLPPLSAADRVRRAANGLRTLQESGLSGATDMGLKLEEAEAFASLDGGDALPLPCDGFLWEDPAVCPALWDRPGRKFRIQGIKLFADGALGSRGAALSAPYEDEPGTKGLLLHGPGVLARLLDETRKRGGWVAIHAIGDGAVDEILAAVASPGGGTRVRLEHAQVLRPDQLSRLAESGVTVSVQPSHFLSDRGWAGARLGARLSWAYRAASLLRAGAGLLLGTDFPIEPPDPRRTFVAALSRGEGENLTFEEVLEAHAPPPWAASLCAATVVRGATPEDLNDPERILDWTLEPLPRGGIP